MKQPLRSTLIALAAALFALPAAADDAETSATTTYRLFVDAFSRGQIDAALQHFSDDARVTAGPGCTPVLPCIGREAIRERYLLALMARRAGPPLADQRFDGQSLRTRGEASFVIGPDGSVTRLIGGHVFGFAGGRIASLQYVLDLADADTARFLAQSASAERTAQR